MLSNLRSCTNVLAATKQTYFCYRKRNRRHFHVLRRYDSFRYACKMCAMNYDLLSLEQRKRNRKSNKFDWNDEVRIENKIVSYQGMRG